MTAREFAQLQGELDEYEDTHRPEEPDLCGAIVYRASINGPEETCSEPVECGSDYCGKHTGSRWDDPDEYPEED